MKLGIKDKARRNEYILCKEIRSDAKIHIRGTQYHTRM
jgi:hypothetical protein